MVDPRYMPNKDDYDGLCAHLVEECAELIKAITKARRFGLSNHHPSDPKKVTNRQHVLDEIADVNAAGYRLSSFLHSSDGKMHF